METLYICFKECMSLRGYQFVCVLLLWIVVFLWVFGALYSIAEEITLFMNESITEILDDTQKKQANKLFVIFILCLCVFLSFF